MPELITMSVREIDRLELVRRIRERRLTSAKAGELLGLSERQVQRLCRRKFAEAEKEVEAPR